MNPKQLKTWIEIVIQQIDEDIKISNEIANRKNAQILIVCKQCQSHNVQPLPKHNYLQEHLDIAYFNGAKQVLQNLFTDIEKEDSE